MLVLIISAALMLTLSVISRHPIDWPGGGVGAVIAGTREQIARSH